MVLKPRIGASSSSTTIKSTLNLLPCLVIGRMVLPQVGIMESLYALNLTLDPLITGCGLTWRIFDLEMTLHSAPVSS